MSKKAWGACVESDHLAASLAVQRILPMSREFLGVQEYHEFVDVRASVGVLAISAARNVVALARKRINMDEE